MSQHDESKHPRGEGGRWTEKAHGVPGPSASLSPEAAAADSDAAAAEHGIGFYGQEPPAGDTGYCARCGEAYIEDPDGSPGVLVHQDDEGGVDYDADEDHAPVPDTAVPDLGLTAAMDASNAAQGYWEPGQGRSDAGSTLVAASDLRVGDRLMLDGGSGTVTVTSLDGDHKDVSIEFDGDEETIASYEPDEQFVRVDQQAFTPEAAYEANRAAALRHLADFDPTDRASVYAHGHQVGIAALALSTTLARDEASRQVAARLSDAQAHFSRMLDTVGHSAQSAQALADACREAIRHGDSTVRTYQGRTAAEWREQAADSSRRSAESFERSDTDGYLTQWAGDAMARKYQACADLAEQGGRSEFPALLDTDGNLVRAKLIDTRYGRAWALLNEDDSFTGDFVNVSKARSAAKRNAYYAQKGFRSGTVRVPATVRLSDGLTPHPYFARTDGGFTPGAEVVATEETEDY